MNFSVILKKTHQENHIESAILVCFSVLYLHNVLGIPEDRVGVEIGSGVEPEMELLLSVAFALAEDVGVKSVRFTGRVSQELEVYLVPCRPFWW